MVKIGKQKEPASIEEIERLETAMGVALPQEYKEFLSRHNGAEPETNIFRINERNDSGVNGFIPIARVMRERRFIAKEIPDSTIPIAWAEGGNYVLLDLQSGTVFFWDHEQPEHGTELAYSFKGFLELLEPFDPSSIQLKPGQVKSVWVDPSLLE